MLAPLTVGNVPLATNLLLAPMAGYADLAFRLLVRSFGGVGLACTALLCPKGVLRGTRQSLALAATGPGDSPLAMQFYGAEAEELCEGARWAEDRGADIIDYNMGCAVPKITRRQAGSRLLCDPDGAVRLVERLVRAVRRAPLTVKLRLGWDDSSIVAPDLARRLEEAGVAAVTVHGRTAAMKFSGQSRLDGIAAVAAAVRRIPVFGNGDVRTPADAARMIQRTGCRGVMIGRAALSAPWIFRDTWSYLTTGAVPPPPSLEAKCQFMRDHFHNLTRLRDERIAVLEFRKCVSWYAKQLHPCRMLRQGMRRIGSAADFERVIGEFLDWRRGRDERAAKTGQPKKPGGELAAILGEGGSA